MTTTGVKSWSQTAATNATADSNVNYQEGQVPSSLNDSARAAMASVAMYRDDMSGVLTTGGTGAGYTLATNQVFQSLAEMDGKSICFRPNVTSTGTQAFINIDSLGSMTIRLGTGIECPAGSLIAGTPYVGVFSNADSILYIHGFVGSPYTIPLAGGLDYWGTTAPNSNFALAAGQAISRSTYAGLFAIIGTTYGTGDGSTTFNLPDKRGRASATPDNMGGTDSNRLSSSAMTSVRTSLGGAGGEGTHTQTSGELPQHRHGVALVDPTHNHSVDGRTNNTTTGGGGFSCAASSPATIGFSATGIQITDGSGNGNVTAITGSGTPFNVVQPTILCNYIIRVL